MKHISLSQTTFSGWFSCSLLSLSLILAGCSSAPPKRQSLSKATLAYIQILNQQPMPDNLPVPVEGINRYQLKDTWGAARSQGRRHEGIDIMAPKNQDVLSATDGVIVDTRDNNLGGHVIWIAGPSGSYHYYAHLNKLKRGLEVGDKVRAGDVIGYVGNTGNARGGATHLHYGIYLAGKGKGAVNPYPYLIGP